MPGGQNGRGTGNEKKSITCILVASPLSLLGPKCRGRQDVPSDK